MLEIAFDSQPNDLFLEKKYPVFEFENLENADWEVCKTTAREFVQKFKNEPVVIVRAKPDMINQLATALLAQSCLIDNLMECVVFKVENHQKAVEAYKPFVALGIAIRYVLPVCGDEPRRIYQGFTELGYLGISYKRDYLQHKLRLFLNTGDQKLYIKAENIEDAVVAAGVLKTLSLMKTGVEAVVDMDETALGKICPEAVVDKLIAATKPWMGEK